MENLKRSTSRDLKLYHAMTTILAATTQDLDGQTVFRQFAFADGAVVINQGWLICSEHGPHHCVYHRTAADAIEAAPHEAAEDKPQQATVNPALLLSPAERLEMHIAAARRAGVGLLDPIPMEFLIPPSLASDAGLSEQLAEAAVEAADAYNADYDAWLDSLPGQGDN